MVCLPQETYQKLRYPSSPELTAPAFESRDERARHPSAVQPSAVDALWVSGASSFSQKRAAELSPRARKGSTQWQEI